ncbi:RNA-dependent RNA polymerase [Frog lyssa-like virus 1]|uniref:Replicase n=1 Tax=Frog lyssa-like virus 1 TaxID=2571313 RepID=A0AAE5ZMX4_9RHAB|nr:RNA-dependent RNA polymerase [Frog lyssa-like virus 1]QCF24331.1 RNA-dependent RNA polymerase [Frog lyssa-like virus 1]
MDLLDSRDFLDEGDEFLGEDPESLFALPEGINLLRNSDYNLNSPLIEDQSKLMMDWLRTGARPHRQRRTPSYLSSYQALKNQSIDWHKISFSDLVTPKLFNAIWHITKIPHDFSKAVSSQLIAFSHVIKDLSSIPLIFLKIHGVSCIEEAMTNPFSSMKESSTEGIYFCNCYGLFFLFHLSVLFMNAIDEVEEREILKVFGMMKADMKGDGGRIWSIRIENDIFPGILVTKEFVFIPSIGSLICRNHVLMLKDIFLSRFNSLCVLGPTSYRTYPGDSINTLIEIYLEGDYLLSSVGNLGYDIIKLLEPLVIKKLVLMAEEFRPLVPHLGDFEDYIHQKVLELSQEISPLARPWAQLLDGLNHKDLLVFVYGCYRHWGHPFIDYRRGLVKLHEQVTMDKTIDREYTSKLASDLAFKLLSFGFNKYSRWFVDIKRVPKKHILFTHIQDHTWPNSSTLELVGDTWHLLPITQIFEIPESLDPSEILDDKSHSVTRKELKDRLVVDIYTPVHSHKVIVTALESDPINPRLFLTTINDNGLPDDDLIIGLKPKERELKRDGRFFALMSWNLRLYFVITEKLLADHILPLFDALTMTDNLNKVFKKLVDRVSGHGLTEYTRVTWAYHLDYEKWNNHQRHESTCDVFKVLDQVFGMKNVFTRTHEFFQESWIYYPDRPDLIRIEENVIGSFDPDGRGEIAWNGQQGGLEGLRQKGWSLISLLMIEREAKTRNTQTKILAQGDNQVLCPTYSLSRGLSRDGLLVELENISRNATSIFLHVKEGAQKLGLIIKGEETMCSHDFLIYGKTPLFRGNVLIPESKRWSRVSCLSNDQVVNIANVMSTVSTNALTVAQHSQSLVKPIMDYLVMSVQAVYHYLLFSPTLKRQVTEILFPSSENLRFFMARIIFLDPSLGGISGMSLGRFHIRQFPDPVTEGLSFWKEISESSHQEWIKCLANEAGFPSLRRADTESLSKLIEDPSSLNLKGGASPSLILRECIREALYTEVDQIKNSEFKEAIKMSKDYKGPFLQYLTSIKPVFPRFLSEFFSSTFLGISESIIGLIQNSRTIRKQFKRNFNKRIGEKFVRSELSAIERLSTSPSRFTHTWECSSKHADLLRFLSWGEKLVGTTVPHPSEMMRKRGITSRSCDCYDSQPEICQERLSVTVLSDFSYSKERRGPLKGYLGSSTSTSTQIFHSWEKVSNVHVVKKSLALRDSINWFIKDGSNLAQSIKDNIKSLLGDLAPNVDLSEFQRTGSALHRFHSSRYSEGGFSPVNPNLLSYVSVSTDTLSEMTRGGKNFDFMFQPLMIYCQTWTIEEILSTYEGGGDTYHWHISCLECIREIDEVTLESQTIYPFPQRHGQITSMNPGVAFKPPDLKEVKFIEKDFSRMAWYDKSRAIGTAQTLLFSILVLIHDSNYTDPSIFPVNVFPKVNPLGFLKGLSVGITIGSSLGFLTRATKSNAKRPFDMYLGVIYFVLEKLKDHPSLYIMMKDEELYKIITSIPHKVPSSYPLSMREGNQLIVNYLSHEIRGDDKRKWKLFCDHSLILFSDFRTPILSHLASIAFQTCKTLSKVDSSLDGKNFVFVQALSSSLRYCLALDGGHSHISLGSHMPSALLKSNIYWVKSEVRHAARGMTNHSSQISEHRGEHKARKVPTLTFGPEWICGFQKVNLILVSEPSQSIPDDLIARYQQKFKDPLISGLRVVQFATGAHYKIKPILKDLHLSPSLVFLIGDGSGGISRVILSTYPDTKILFNSLLDWNDMLAPGSSPLPPSALMYKEHQWRSRIVNWRKEWEKPSDLRTDKCWSYMRKCCEDLDLEPDLIICDAEVVDRESIEKIVMNICDFCFASRKSNYVLIFKTYLTVLSDSQFSIISHLSRCFSSFVAYVTDVTSSKSSELYLVCKYEGVRDSHSREISSCSLVELASIIKSQKTIRDELTRAQSIRFTDMVAGFPTEIIPGPISDISSTLVHEGFDSTLIPNLCDFMSSQTTNAGMLNAMITLMCLFSNSIINTTREFEGSHLAPESNPRLSSHFNTLLGISSFLTMRSDHYDNHVVISRLMNNPPIYYYKLVRNSRGQLFKGWSWFSPSVTVKKIPVNSDISLASHWVRICFKYFKDSHLSLSSVSQSSLNSGLMTFNKKMSVASLFTRTSSLDLLVSRR